MICGDRTALDTKNTYILLSKSERRLYSHNLSKSVTESSGLIEEYAVVHFIYRECTDNAIAVI